MHTFALLSYAVPDRALLSRAVLLIGLLSLALVFALAGMVILMQMRRRTRSTPQSRSRPSPEAADPWQASAGRTETPSAEELYQGSGFDDDDTRIEDSPDFGDEPPGDPPKPPKPPRAPPNSGRPPGPPGPPGGRRPRKHPPDNP